MATAAANVISHPFGPTVRINMPTDEELKRLPLAQGGKYRCNASQAEFLQRRCWKLNIDNAAFRFSTRYYAKKRILHIYRLEL